MERYALQWSYLITVLVLVCSLHMILQSAHTGEFVTVLRASLDSASEIIALSTSVLPLAMITNPTTITEHASRFSCSVLTIAAATTDPAYCLIFQMLTDTNATTGYAS